MLGLSMRRIDSSVLDNSSWPGAVPCRSRDSREKRVVFGGAEICYTPGVLMWRIDSSLLQSSSCLGAVPCRSRVRGWCSVA
jgi:hypothetical protein